MRGKTDVDALLKGTDTEGLDLLPADFSYRHMDLALGDAKRPRAPPQPRARAAQGRVRVHVPGLPAEHLARDASRVFEAADALLVPIIPATLSVAHARAAPQRARARQAGPQVLGFFSMADRRKKLHRELMDSLAPSTTCSRP